MSSKKSQKGKAKAKAVGKGEKRLRDSESSSSDDESRDNKRQKTSHPCHSKDIVVDLKSPEAVAYATAFLQLLDKTADIKNEAGEWLGLSEDDDGLGEIVGTISTFVGNDADDKVPSTLDELRDLPKNTAQYKAVQEVTAGFEAEYKVAGERRRAKREAEEKKRARIKKAIETDPEVVKARAEAAKLNDEYKKILKEADASESKRAKASQLLFTANVAATNRLVEARKRAEEAENKEEEALKKLKGSDKVKTAATKTAGKPSQAAAAGSGKIASTVAKGKPKGNNPRFNRGGAKEKHRLDDEYPVS